jgi:hypothetical protein
MALIKVHDELAKDEIAFNTIINAFDVVETVDYDPQYKVTTLRVQREEIPKDDQVICPSFYSFPGVLPFIIDFGV